MAKKVRAQYNSQVRNNPKMEKPITLRRNLARQNQTPYLQHHQRSPVRVQVNLMLENPSNTNSVMKTITGHGVTIGMMAVMIMPLMLPNQMMMMIHGNPTGGMMMTKPRLGMKMIADGRTTRRQRHPLLLPASNLLPRLLNIWLLLLCRRP